MDHVWDAVHTFIRAPGAMVVIAVVMAGQDPTWQVLAVLLAGGVAFTAHAGKASTRVVSTKATAAVANAFVSVAEDVVVVAGAWLAAFHPLVLGALVLAALAAAAVFGPKVIRSLRLSWAFAFHYVRYLWHRLRRWLARDWRPRERALVLPAALGPLAAEEEPLAAARVVVGRFGRRRFGYLLLWPDRLALLIKKGLRPKPVTYYYRELDDAYSDNYATFDQLVFAARGRTYVVSFFKGREPTAASALALITAARAAA